MAIRLTVRAQGGTAEYRYEFDQGRIVIGRGAGADVRLPDAFVSENHAVVSLAGRSYVIQDDSSTNGTRVNGTRLVQSRAKVIRSGDAIQIGRFELGFEADIAISETTDAQHTAALARRILCEVIDPVGTSRAPRLIVVSGPQTGEELVLEGTPSRKTIGRGEEADFVLVDADASRLHAEVIRGPEGLLIRDLGSKNGLVVQNRVLLERALAHGDEVQLGSTFFVVEDEAALRLTESAGIADEVAPPELIAERPQPAKPVEPAPSIKTPTPPPAETPRISLDDVKKARDSFIGRPRKIETLIFGFALAVLAVSLLALFLLFHS